MTKTYELKNKLLAYPADWYVTPEVLAAAKETTAIFTEFYQGDGQELPAHMPFDQMIAEPVKEVFASPIFSETFVRILRDEIANMKAQGLFRPNDDEDELRQIPEVVLQHIVPELFKSIMTVVHNVLTPITLTLWGRVIEDGGIQIANYNPTGKRKGAWHHDASSDITIVVPLNTGEYVGGGTEFARRGVVPPLPNGSGLIFPALTHMHRGLAVEEGDRYLLVFWLKCSGKEI